MSVYDERGNRLDYDNEPSITSTNNAYLYVTLNDAGNHELKFAIEPRESGWTETDSRDNVRYRTYTWESSYSGPRYEKASKLRVYKFYYDPLRTPANKKPYSAYLVGELDLISTADKGYMLPLDDYASLVGGSVQDYTFERYGLKLQFNNNSTSFKVISGHFYDNISLDARTNIPTSTLNGKCLVDVETFVKASGSIYTQYNGNVLEVLDPMYHYKHPESPYSQEKGQSGKKIFVGGPWITGWNTSTTDSLRLAKNFVVSEFKCKERDRCTCGKTIIVAKDMVDDWQKVRDQLGSLIVTSGYRCCIYNRVLGATTGSRDQFGDAADISPSSVSVSHLHSFIRENLWIGHNNTQNGSFGGLAVKTNSFVHADTRSYSASWTY